VGELAVGRGATAAFVDHPVPIRLGPFAETDDRRRMVKTALMPVFFFVVGLEIKNEILRGELSNPRRLALPILAAAAGWRRRRWSIWRSTP
jgi:NhaA family Na+:H+ antiporter